MENWELKPMLYDSKADALHHAMLPALFSHLINSSQPLLTLPQLTPAEMVALFGFVYK